ncbi:Uncharacterised protein [Segatella copri]|nr:Uncharacterised protein [Segatella copri]
MQQQVIYILVFRHQTYRTQGCFLLVEQFLYGTCYYGMTTPCLHSGNLQGNLSELRIIVVQMISYQR